MIYAFLHGFTGAPDAFDAVAAGLPVGALCVRPYLVGHGPESRSAVSFDAEVGRLATLIEESPAVPVHLVGYSLGSRLALALALARPALVRRLTLVGPSAGIEDAEERRARARADDALAAVLRFEGMEAFVGRWEAQPIFASQGALMEAQRAGHRARRASHDPEALASALAVLSKGRMAPMWSRLEQVRVAVDLVAGELDVAFVREARAMAERLPTARVHVVPGAGHDVVLERPAELTAILLGAGA